MARKLLTLDVRSIVAVGVLAVLSSVLVRTVGAQGDPMQMCCVPAHVGSIVFPDGAHEDCTCDTLVEHECALNTGIKECDGVRWEPAVHGECKTTAGGGCTGNATTFVTIRKGEFSCPFSVVFGQSCDDHDDCDCDWDPLTGPENMGMAPVPECQGVACP